MERGEPGRRYLLGGENLTLAGFLGMLSELCGVPRAAVAGALRGGAGRRLHERVLV